VKKFLQSWAINTLAVLIAVYVVSGIHYRQPLDLLAASLLLGILNAGLRPILMLVALPLLLFTLGLFTLVINAGLLYLVGTLLRPYFSIDSFWSAFWGALVISLVSVVLNSMIGSANSKVRVTKAKGRPPPRRDDDGQGPIIDV
jgi:putative membrane protein